MRKEVDVTITDEGRDKGKKFALREMPASKAEKWAARFLLALTRSGAEIPEGIEKEGMRGVAVMGIKMLAAVNYNDAESLLDEMFTCVRIKPDPSKDLIRELIEDDIEEIATRVQLRAEVFMLHTNFSSAALKQMWDQAKRKVGSLNTQTSQGQSAQ